VFQPGQSSDNSQSRRRSTRAKPPARPMARLRLESLESREVPAWISEGPAPVTGTQSTLTAVGSVSGAVDIILANPTAPTVMYVATVKGGIWKTTDGTSSSPTWTPLTDNLPSLSIGTMALDQLNPSIVWAGTGLRSSFIEGDVLTGLYKSLNGGTTWSQINPF